VVNKLKENKSLFFLKNRSFLKTCNSWTDKSIDIYDIILSIINYLTACYSVIIILLYHSKLIFIWVLNFLFGHTVYSILLLISFKVSSHWRFRRWTQNRLIFNCREFEFYFHFWDAFLQHNDWMMESKRLTC
jgi:hypothetical protein